MERCTYEFCSAGIESKRDERTREEQFAQRKVSLAVFLCEQGALIDKAKNPEALGMLLAEHGERLSVEDFLCLSELLQAKFGPVFARRAGLPVRPPRLRVA